MSARYVIPARRGLLPNGIFRHHGQKDGNCEVLCGRVLATVCSRCGEARGSRHHVCKAIGRQCYVCRKYGHFAQVCVERLISVNSACVVRSSMRKQAKSQRRQQRDRERYITFVNRKSTALEMPFSSVDNQELQKCLPKYLGESATHSKFKNLEKKCVSYVCAIEDLTDRAKSLQEAVNYEQSGRRKAETTLQIVKIEVAAIRNSQSKLIDANLNLQKRYDEKIRALENENQQIISNRKNLQQEIQAFKEENRQLKHQIKLKQEEIQSQSTKCKERRSENSELTLKLKSITKHRNRLENDCRMLRNENKTKARTIEDLQCANKDLSCELNNLKSTVRAQNIKFQDPPNYSRKDFNPR